MIFSSLVGGSVLAKVFSKKAVALYAVAACGTDLAVVEDHRQAVADTAVAVIAPTGLGAAMHLQKDARGIEIMRIDDYAEIMLGMCSHPYRYEIMMDGSRVRRELHLVDLSGKNYPCEKWTPAYKIQMKSARFQFENGPG